MMIVLEEGKVREYSDGPQQSAFSFPLSRVHSIGPQSSNHTANLKKYGPKQRRAPNQGSDFCQLFHYDA
jgi:hypothetical protein